MMGLFLYGKVRAHQVEFQDWYKITRRVSPIATVHTFYTFPDGMTNSDFLKGKYHANLLSFQKTQKCLSVSRNIK